VNANGYKGRVRRGIAIAAAAVICLSSADAALAKEIRYSGRSSQHKAVTLRTDSHGVLTRFAIRVRMDCGSTNYTFLQRFIPRFDAANKDGFHDHGRYSQKVDDGVRLKARASVIGHRKRSDRFAGTLDVKHVYVEDGDAYETCRARNVRWSATKN
jgi:hypothetical protein